MELTSALAGITDPRENHSRGSSNSHHSAGSFKKPLFKKDGVTCIGVETVDGTKYFADKVVLATGAWSPTLVDLEDQCCSKVRPARNGHPMNSSFH